MVKVEMSLASMVSIYIYIYEIEVILYKRRSPKVQNPGFGSHLKLRLKLGRFVEIGNIKGHVGDSNV
jgi:hypothetical protein